MGYIAELGIDISTETTAKLQQMLKKVYHGELSQMEALDQVKAKIQTDLGKCARRLESRNNQAKKTQPSLGKCPKCGQDEVEIKLAYSCSNRQRKLVLWKEASGYYSHYFSAIGFHISKVAVWELLKNGRTFAKNRKAKSGKFYTAYIAGDFLGEWAQWRLEFPEKKKR